MAGLSRRTFVGWIGAVSALIGARRGIAATLRPVALQTAPLSPASLRALAEAVLPAALGPAGIERATREFSTWVREYRAGAEILHPYGSEEVTTAPRLPLASWRSQLASLETGASRRHGHGFAALGIPERQALVRESLAAVQGSSLPPVESAPHVALAVLAHFYDSPTATDLCYRVQIGRNQCRPLVHNPRQPLPLAGGPD